MTQSVDNRPGVDTKIVQTAVLRGCDALFPGNQDGVLLTIRGADAQGSGAPGDVWIMPGLNAPDDSTVSTVYHLNRSTSDDDPIFVLVSGTTPAAATRFAIHGGSGTPEGDIFARESSLYFDNTTPGLWIKTTDDSLNTGWEQLATVNVTAEDLEETLQIGNVTGALPIIVNNTNSGLHGEDGVGANGISYTIRAGNSGGGNAGQLDVFAGQVTAGGGNGGQLRMAGGASTGGAAGGAGGGVTISGGLSGGANDGGSIDIIAGTGGPSAGGGGGDINVVGGTGGGGTGGGFNFTGGDGATGLNGGSFIVTGGSGSPGGAVEIRSGEGVGANAAGGPVTLAAGDPDAGGGPGASVLISASNAVGAFSGGNITLNPGTGATGDGAVIVNGKLTVTGIIDPIGVIFQETAGEADVTVPANEGAVYVSDGSNGRTANGLYYKDSANNHYQLAPPPAGSSFIESFSRITFGYMSVNADSGTEIDSVGRLNGHTVSTAGGAITSRTAGSQGAFFQLGSGAVADTSYSALETNSTLLRRDARPLVVFKFQLGGTATAQRVFMGVTNQGPAFHANANNPTGGGSQYAGFQVAAGTGNFQAVSHSSSGGGIFTGVNVPIDINVHYVVIDMTVDDRITWTLLDEDFNVEATTVNATATSLPLSGSFLDVMVANGTSDASVNNLRFFHCMLIERADVLAQAFGGGAAPLATVLALGNTTGGNDIQITHGDLIQGTNDGNAPDGGDLVIVSGNASAVAGNSGAITIFSNAVLNVAATGDTGAVSLQSGPILLAGQTGDTGLAALRSGLTLGTGDTGNVELSTGNSTSGTAGDILGTAGNGDQGGGITLTAGDSAGVGLQGGIVTLTGGNSGDAQGGNVEIFGGTPTAGNNDGGSIVLTPGAGIGTGADGVVFVAGKLTVTGIIDPTGLVLDNQASVPDGTPSPGKSTLWVRSSDNALIVTDDGGVDTEVGTGGGSTTLGGLTDVTITAPAIGQVLTFNGVDWENADSAAGGGTLNLAESLGEISWGWAGPGGSPIATEGAYTASSVTSVSGSGVVVDTQGQDEGPYSIFFTDSGLAPNHGGYFLNSSQRTNYQGRCFTTIKFRVGSIATAADPQFFAGWTQNSGISLTGQLNSANVPVAHVGVEIDELNNAGETTFYFTFDEDATGKSRVNTGVAFNPSQELFVTIDATVANAVTVSLYDASYTQLATNTFTTTPTLLDYNIMVAASTTNPGDTRFDVFHARNVWRADLIAALAGVGSAALDAVLASGNATGGNDIVITAGDGIVGQDTGIPSALNISAGNATATGAAGASLNFIAGAPFGAAGDNSGTITVQTADAANSAGGDAGDAGDIAFQTGAGGDTTLAGSAGGDGGDFSIIVGAGGDATTGAAGVGGQFAVQTGDGGAVSSGTGAASGSLLLNAGTGGTSSSGDGGNASAIELNGGTGGTGTGAGNQGGNGSNINIVSGSGGPGAAGGDGGNGGNVFIGASTGGSGAAAGTAGRIGLLAGTSSVLAPGGGSVYMESNQVSGTTLGARITVLPATTGAGGSVDIGSGGALAGSGADGGSIDIGAGTGEGAGDGGSITVQAGNGGATGTAGVVTVTAGASGTGFGEVQLLGEVGTLPHTAFSALVDGAVWMAGATSNGATGGFVYALRGEINGADIGGDAGVRAGDAAAASGEAGGAADLRGGDADGIGAAGAATVTGGDSPGGPGGDAVLQGGLGVGGGNAEVNAGAAAVASGDVGGDVFIRAGAGDGAGDNGAVSVLGGTFSPPVSPTNGSIIVSARPASSGTDGGYVLVSNSTGGVGGGVTLQGGDAAGASGDAGGDVNIQGGAGDGAGANGSIVLTPGTGGTGAGVIDLDGLIERDADGYKHGTTATAATSTAVSFSTPFPAGPAITINVTIETGGAGSPPPVWWIHTVSGSGFTLEFASSPPGGTVIHWSARQ